VSGKLHRNCFVEWTNEQDPAPNTAASILSAPCRSSGNIISFGRSRPVVQLYRDQTHGGVHVITGLTINDNRFRSTMGLLIRVERYRHRALPPI